MMSEDAALVKKLRKAVQMIKSAKMVYSVVQIRNA